MIQVAASGSAQVLQQAQSALSPGHPSPEAIRTAKNVFSLYHQYSTTSPTHDPEEELSLDDLSNIPSKSSNTVTSHNKLGLTPQSFGPYPNYNSFRIGDWYWNRSQKSQADFRDLVAIIGDLDFQPADVRHTRWDSINSQLAGDPIASGDWEWVDDEREGRWTCTPFTITVPFHRRTPNPGPQTYHIEGFYHRNLVSVIRERLVNNSHFHFDPYELYWHVGELGSPVRVHGEMYTSPAFLKAHQELQDSPRVPGCNLPRVVAALMFWSDSTQLASFGDASLWPLYMFMGNESKYRRCKPSQHLCSHVAYFKKVCALASTLDMCFYMMIKLPDAFKDFATHVTEGKGPNDAFYTHCRREAMHEQWRILLDDEFLDAYNQGIVILCVDGMERRFYPRIFTYSADYPEKCVFIHVIMIFLEDKLTVY
jgi:hypothetical protein